jgi:hypothetical protein
VSVRSRRCTLTVLVHLLRSHSMSFTRMSKHYRAWLIGSAAAGVAAAGTAAAAGLAPVALADKKDDNFFDPEALERGAKALREINKSPYAKQVRSRNACHALDSSLAVHRHPHTRVTLCMHTMLARFECAVCACCRLWSCRGSRKSQSRQRLRQRRLSSRHKPTHMPRYTCMAIHAVPAFCRS